MMEGIIEEEFLKAFSEYDVEYFNSHKEEITSEMYCWYYRAEADLSRRNDRAAGLRRLQTRNDEEWRELESLGKQLAGCVSSMRLLDGYLKELGQRGKAEVMCLPKSDVWPVDKDVFDNLELVKVLSATQRGVLTECLRSKGNKPADRFSLSWHIGYVGAMLDKFEGNETKLGEHLHEVIDIGPTYYKNNKKRYQKDCNVFDSGVVDVGGNMYEEIVKSGMTNVG